MTPKDAYRIAWLDYIEKPSIYLQETMDQLQPFITFTANDEWNEFILSLPGYIEFWNKLEYRILDKAKQTFLS